MKDSENKPALLVVNGELPGMKLLANLIERCQFVLCTDGAAIEMMALDLHPDLIIGDLDSIDHRTTTFYQANSEIIANTCQYSTDLEKAFKLLESRRFSDVIVTGLGGKRIDHGITNIHMLASLSERFNIEVVDDFGSGPIISANESDNGALFEAELDPGTIVSLIPLQRVKNVSTTGLLYPLLNEDLGWGERSGQSNQAVENKVSVSWTEGRMLIYTVQMADSVTQ